MDSSIYSAARPGILKFWYSHRVRSTSACLLLLIAIALAPLPWTSAQTGQPPAPPATSVSPTPQGKGAAPGLAVVVIDPAHGGADSGARGPSGVLESDVVLDFARAIRVALEGRGFRVLLTREGNQDPSFDDRSTLINGLRDGVFLSLHVSSTGPPATARAYSLLFTPEVLPDSAAPAPAVPPHGSLMQWDRAQLSYAAASRQLAELMQVQLAQKFKGSPDVPLSAAVRQLRTIAAPAIAIEVSSVAAASGPQLAQMGQPLADAVARAVMDYRQALGGSTGNPVGAR